MRKKRFNKTVARREMKKAWRNKGGAKKPSKAALAKAMRAAWK